MNLAASVEDVHHDCGRATITPHYAVAGTFETWRIIHTVGAYGLDIGARLRLAFRLASDLGPLQSDHPEAPGNKSVESLPAGGVFRVRFDPRGHTRPWSQAFLIDVVEHELAPGSHVIITVGDTSGGSAGCSAETFVEHPFRFLLLTDPLGTGEFVALADPLEIDVAAGPAPSSPGARAVDGLFAHTIWAHRDAMWQTVLIAIIGSDGRTRPRWTLWQFVAYADQGRMGWMPLR